MHNGQLRGSKSHHFQILLYGVTWLPQEIHYYNNIFFRLDQMLSIWPDNTLHVQMSKRTPWGKCCTAYQADSMELYAQECRLGLSVRQGISEMDIWGSGLAKECRTILCTFDWNDNYFRSTHSQKWSLCISSKPEQRLNFWTHLGITQQKWLPFFIPSHSQTFSWVSYRAVSSYIAYAYLTWNHPLSWPVLERFIRTNIPRFNLLSFWDQIQCLTEQ